MSQGKDVRWDYITRMILMKTDTRFRDAMKIKPTWTSEEVVSLWTSIYSEIKEEQLKRLS